MYKVETHLHTSHVSRCGRLDAATIVREYKKAGYSVICVTDHYSRITFDFLGVNIYDDSDKITPFLEGYKRVREEGKKIGIEVFCGAEVRFDESENDYLVYGFNNKLLSDPGRVFEMGIAEFSRHAREAGALIIQAHPYRDRNTPAIAKYIDGVEVLNLHPRHENNNEQAAKYAEAFGLLGTSGSDCHQMEDIARGGIIIDTIPKDSINLARTIRYRHFKLIKR